MFESSYCIPTELVIQFAEKDIQSINRQIIANRRTLAMSCWLHDEIKRFTDATDELLRNRKM